MTETREYIVKAGQFEGPLELLLELIEKRKLFINEISLSEVTNDYLNYVKGLERYNFAHVTSFLIIAATLILIKSKSLLPSLEITGEEKNDISDLEKRLLLYKVYKDASVVIKDTFGRTVIYETQKIEKITPIFTPDKRITPEFLHATIIQILKAIPEEKPLSQISVKKIMSLEEMMQNLTERIYNLGSFSFNSISKHPNPESQKEAKIYTIVSFLAMLEMVRSGIIDIIQNDLFSDMNVTKQENIQ